MSTHRDLAIALMEEQKAWPADDAGRPAALAEAQMHATLHLADMVKVVAYVMNGGHPVPHLDADRPVQP